MKRIAAIITLLLAFTVSANAQNSRSMAAAEEAAKKDAVELATFLELTEDVQKNLVELFKYKHQMMSDATITEGQKIELSKNVAAKINASLDEKQQQKLAANPELLEKLSK